MTLISDSTDATVRGSLPGAGQLAALRELPSSWHRALLIFCGIALISALIIARCLTPDASGFGTHRQLGLPECTFVEFTGLPCPSCGMTTSWAHLTRGHWLQAAESNVGGLLAGVTAIFAGPWMLVSGLRGRWFVATPNLALVGTLAFATYAAILCQWFGRMWFS